MQFNKLDFLFTKKKIPFLKHAVLFNFNSTFVKALHTINKEECNMLYEKQANLSQVLTNEKKCKTNKHQS